MCLIWVQRFKNISFSELFRCFISIKLHVQILLHSLNLLNFCFSINNNFSSAVTHLKPEMKIGP